MQLPSDFWEANREFHATVKRNGWELARAWLLASTYSQGSKDLVIQRAARKNTAELVVDYRDDIAGNRPVPGAMGA